VVAGDSRTGETQKLDGIYYVIRWVLRQPRLPAIVPVLGDATRVRFNIVPRDYVVDAIAELSSRADTFGSTYTIADPDPATINKLLDQLAQTSGRRIVKVRLPLGLAKTAISHVPGLMSLMGIPADAADYFAHPHPLRHQQHGRSTQRHRPPRLGSLDVDSGPGRFHQQQHVDDF
jgi:uncharacterized protein YbjT (DUF2867 family)